MYTTSSHQNLSTAILKISLTVLLCLLINSVKGQQGTGCQERGPTYRIYQGRAGYLHMGNDVYRWIDGPTSWNSTDWANNPCVTWEITQSGRCYILQTNGSYVRGDHGTFKGPLGIENCPIDDFIPLLFIPIGLTAGYFFRKKQYC